MKLQSLLALPALAALLAACGVPDTSQPASTATVKKGDLVQTVGATGATVASTQAKLSFKLGGKIASVSVAAGDQVAAGQVLAELDSSDVQAAVQQAQAARDAASAAVAAAQAKVDQLQQSAKPENIAQANAAANIAKSKLQDMLNGGRPEQVAQAQAQLDAANQKLSTAESGARQEQVQQAQAALQAAQAKLQALQNGPRPEQVAILQKQIDGAKSALYGAQTNRDGACNPHNPDYLCSAANAQVSAAQTAVDTAGKQLELATAPPTQTDLQQAQAAVEQAKAQVAMLQSNSPEDVQQARDAVTQAQQGLALAQSPYTPEQIQQARETVAQANAGAQLAAHPFTDADLAAAQAGVQQAQAQVGQADAALNAAQTNLGFAQLKAPAAGKVLQVNNSAGEVVSPASVPIVLGIGDVLVNISLAETAVSQVKVGQDVDIVFDSLAGKTYAGKITDVSPTGTTSQNLISYVATAKINQPDDAIRPSMNAKVTIYTLRKQDVLLVPRLAVQSYQGKEIVMAVASDGQSKQTEVQTGAGDPQNLEVLNGLSEGQRVALISKPLNGISLTGSK
jgi:HlyD family secretion protein